MALLAKRKNGALTPFRSTISNLLDIDRFFDSNLFDLGNELNNLPAVNIAEHDKNFKVEVAAPGFSKKDFKIENDILTISAEKKEEKNEVKKDFRRREFNYASFECSFGLPDNVNDDHVNAEYNDGILKLTIHKKERTAKKKVKEIEVA